MRRDAGVTRRSVTCHVEARTAPSGSARSLTPDSSHHLIASTRHGRSFIFAGDKVAVGRLRLARRRALITIDVHV